MKIGIIGIGNIGGTIAANPRLRDTTYALPTPEDRRVFDASQRRSVQRLQM
jgi:predicted dinucleotide-binding enzyme